MLGGGAIGQFAIGQEQTILSPGVGGLRQMDARARIAFVPANFSSMPPIPQTPAPNGWTQTMAPRSVTEARRRTYEMSTALPSSTIVTFPEGGFRPMDQRPLFPFSPPQLSSTLPSSVIVTFPEGGFRSMDPRPRLPFSALPLSSTLPAGTIVTYPEGGFRPLDPRPRLPFVPANFCTTLPSSVIVTYPEGGFRPMDPRPRLPFRPGDFSSTLPSSVIVTYPEGGFRPMDPRPRLPFSTLPLTNTLPSTVVVTFVEGGFRPMDPRPHLPFVPANFCTTLPSSVIVTYPEGGFRPMDPRPRLPFSTLPLSSTLPSGAVIVYPEGGLRPMDAPMRARASVVRWSGDVLPSVETPTTGGWEQQFRTVRPARVRRAESSEILIPQERPTLGWLDQSWARAAIRLRTPQPFADLVVVPADEAARLGWLGEHFRTTQPARARSKVWGDAPPPAIEAGATVAGVAAWWERAQRGRFAPAPLGGWGDAPVVERIGDVYILRGVLRTTMDLQGILQDPEYVLRGRMQAEVLLDGVSREVVVVRGVLSGPIVLLGETEQT